MGWPTAPLTIQSQQQPHAASRPLKSLLRRGFDPGVEFVSARSPSNLSALIPSTKTRMTGLKWVDLTHLPSDELLPLVPLALHNMIDYAGLPGMMVQLTAFACGSCVLAIKMAHPLADAQALMCFMHDWAAKNRAMLASTLLLSLSPVFDPSLVDQAAAGDIDAPEPDQSLVQEARRLPLHPFDWWTSAEGCPS